MSDINSVTLTGRLTKDPGEQTNCTYFTLAVNTHFKIGSEWKCRATYVFCKAWGFLAKKAAKLSKGQMVALLGTVESYVKDKQTHLFINIRRLTIIPLSKSPPEEEVPDPGEEADLF